ncbi:MAG: hypothetical protein ACK5Q5_18085 [Planctomycetaceae bacterium]
MNTETIVLAHLTIAPTTRLLALRDMTGQQLEGYDMPCTVMEGDSYFVLDDHGKRRLLSQCDIVSLIAAHSNVLATACEREPEECAKFIHVFRQLPGIVITNETQFGVRRLLDGLLHVDVNFILPHVTDGRTLCYDAFCEERTNADPAWLLGADIRRFTCALDDFDVISSNRVGHGTVRR